MPILSQGGVDLYYEEYGSGYPILMFAPGGLRSQIAYWRHRPYRPDMPPSWPDPTMTLSQKFRVIIMDQRNVGRSRAPITAKDDWRTFSSDHLRLMDHLGIDRFHVSGACIGCTFSLTLCHDVPDRISSAVLIQPIGSFNNEAVVEESFQTWLKWIREARPDLRDQLDEKTLAGFKKNLYGSGFVYSVSRDFVKHCKTPLMLLPGDDPHHPKPISDEIASLNPAIEVVSDWKGEHNAESVARVLAFLEKHTPRK